MPRREKDDAPDPIDVHVGKRIRMRRMELKIPQMTLGDAIGVTFQQVQKYERGANRIGASRMYKMAKILKVPVGYLFEGLGSEKTVANDLLNLLGTPDGSRLAIAFDKITDLELRRTISAMVVQIASRPKK